MVVLAAVVLLFSANRSTANLDPGTPEGVVQSYLTAVLEGDYVEAARHLDPSSGCDVEDLDRMGTVEPARAVLVDSQVNGDTARLTVRVTMTAGPFEAEEFSENHIFRLTRTGQDWKLSGTPWPLYGCEGDVK